MDKYRILHLSDVHFGVSDPDGEQTRLLNGIEKALVAAESQIDLIVFSGDLTNGGIPSEFLQGTQWLTSLSDSLKAPIIATIGNHDIFRMNADKAQLRLACPTSESYQTLKPKIFNSHPHVNNFVAWYSELADEGCKYLDCWNKLNPYIGHHRSDFTGIALNIICLNTAILSCDYDDQNKLCVDIAEFNKCLETVDVEKELVIVVAHHPLNDWLSEWNEKKLNMLIKQKTGPHLYLHGHTHNKAGTSAYSQDGEGICVLGAGAAYQGSEWAQSFAVVEIDFDDKKVKPLTYEYISKSGLWIRNEAISQPITADIPRMKKKKATIFSQKISSENKINIIWGNPFDHVTSNAIKPHEIPKLFVDENNFISRLINPANTIVEGQRGTGKTMLLRYLSAEVQSTLLEVDAENELLSKFDNFMLKKKYIGVYTSLLNSGFDRSDLDAVESSARRESLFEQRMVLKLVPIVVSVCAGLFDEDHLLAVQGVKTQTLLARILKKKEILNSSTWGELLEAVEDECNSLLQELNEHISSLLPGGINTTYNPWMTLKESLFTLLEKIKKEMGYPFPFYILLDDFDALGAEDQSIVFKIARERRYELVCFKFGVMTLGLKTSSAGNGNSFSVGNDYDYIPLAWTDKGLKTTSSISGNYEKTVTKIVEKRLSASKWPQGINFKTLFANWTAGTRIRNEVKLIEEKRYSELDENERPESFESYWSKQGNALYLRYLKKKGTVHLYAGPDTIIDISSGIFRQFLEVCSSIVSTAFDRGWVPQVDKKIGTSAQNDAIRAYSKDMLNLLNIGGGDGVSSSNMFSITSKDILVFTNSLLEFFASKLYSDCKDGEVISISVKDKMIEPSFGKYILESAVRMSILHRREIDYTSKNGGVNKLPTYLLNRRLAPEKNLGLKMQGRYELSLADIELAARATDKFIESTRTKKPVHLREDPNQGTFL